MRRAAALLVLLPAALLLAGCGGPDREAYVEGNEAVLSEVPVYPGAKRTATWNLDHKDCNGWPEGMGPATSYSTTHVYRLPRALSAGPVLAFYERRLGGSWTSVVETDCEETFAREPALLSVTACHGDLLLRVDHGAYREPSR